MQSWILEVRDRLATPPAIELAADGARQVVLVPLFVDAGELWIVLAAPSGRELVPGAATLPAALLAGGLDPWTTAEPCAAHLGIEPSTILRLGMLDHLPTPAGEVIVPCVGAVPPPQDSPALQRLPLVAARTPSLVEERRVVTHGAESWVRVAHCGPVKLAGPEVEIVELLLERLVHGGS